MQTVAALFVDPKGPYPTLPHVEVWDETRDARLYTGPHPVVAHPPCNLWVNFAALNWKRYGRQRPAWYPGGDDGGCFSAALQAVRQYGGVLEHPAYTHAWEQHGLERPTPGRWTLHCWGSSVPVSYPRCAYWTAEIFQAVYGHKAQKRTWLLYCGIQPPYELDWSHLPGTHQIGWFDRNKKTLGKQEASLTPLALAQELVCLARWSRACRP